MTYNFEPYDVLQIRRNDGKDWQDFSTLRDEKDSSFATELVDRGRWDGLAVQFRIVQKFPFTIKYAQENRL